jgi:SOS-response transcriptional repressor LexA
MDACEIIPPLTERQRALLRFVQNTRDEQGVSPSYADVAEHFQICLNAAKKGVVGLIAKGCFIQTYGVRRSTRLTALGRKALG